MALNPSALRPLTRSTPPRGLRLLGPMLAGLLTSTALAPAQAELGPRHPATVSALSAEQARVIVKLRARSSILAATPGATTAATAAQTGPRAASALGQRLALALRDGRALDARTQVLRASGLSSQALAQQLARLAEVEWVVPDERRFASAAPNDPLYADGQRNTTPAAGQWYLRAPTSTLLAPLDVERAWAVTEGRDSVTVAVLDTGVRTRHPDLADRLWPGYDFVNNVFTANDGNTVDSDPNDPGDWITANEDSSGFFKGCGASDSSWHGTQTAGLVAATAHNHVGMSGVAPNVRLLPVRVLGKCGGYDSDIIAGMRWAAGLSLPGLPSNPHPARVINLSLGSAGTCPASYRDALSAVSATGAVVVVAAGNEGGAVDSPANCPGAVAVAGVRHAGTKVGYSNLGTGVALAAPAGNCVNDALPCLYPIVSTSSSGTQGPGLTTYTDGTNYAVGTSFSAPLVAGTAALMLSAHPALTPAEVKALLQSTARPFPAATDASVPVCREPTAEPEQAFECHCTTSTCGAGMLDAGQAVFAAAAAASGGAVAAFTHHSDSLSPGQTLVLDAAPSLGQDGAAISGYAWTLVSGSALALESGASDRSSQWRVTAWGTATVRLTVTDANGQTASSERLLSFTDPASVTVSVDESSGTGSGGGSGGGGGGGSQGWVWTCGLLLAGWALRRPRAG